MKGLYTFSQSSWGVELKLSPKEEQLISNEVINFLKKGIIKEPQQFISPMFLVPKRENDFRIILCLKRLKRLNENMPYLHFKMETILLF